MVKSGIKYISLFSVLLIVATNSFGADITWKFFLSSTSSSGPIFEITAPAGQEIVFEESETVSVPGESQNIISALDNSRFNIQSLPVNKNITINTVFNVTRNKFQSLSGTSLFLNVKFDVYIDGIKQDNFTLFSSSPLTITIPDGSGLDELLSLANCSKSDNLISVYYYAGKFQDDGISLIKSSSQIIIRANKLSQIACGKDTDLGFPSNIQADTWSKIKLLFK